MLGCTEGTSSGDATVWMPGTFVLPGGRLSRVLEVMEDLRHFGAAHWVAFGGECMGKGHPALASAPGATDPRAGLHAGVDHAGRADCSWVGLTCACGQPAP